MSLSYDGNYLFVGTSTLGAFYTFWNGQNYTTLTQIPNSIIPTNSSLYWSLVVSSDMKTIYYNLNSGTIKELPITLSNATYTTLATPNAYATSINDNSWRHYVWTISPSGVYTYYVNNTAVYTTGSGLTYPSPVTRVTNYIGNSLSNPRSYFNGGIDDFRMYNRVLTTTQIAAIYNKTEYGYTLNNYINYGVTGITGETGPTGRTGTYRTYWSYWNNW